MAQASSSDRATAYLNLRSKRKEQKAEVEFQDSAVGRKLFSVRREFPVVGGNGPLLRNVVITTDSSLAEGDPITYNGTKGTIHYYGYVPDSEKTRAKLHEDVMQPWADYLADVTRATEFHVILSGGGLTGVSFTYAMVAAVHGFDSSWIYSGNVGPGSMLLCAIGMSEEQMLKKL